MLLDSQFEKMGRLEFYEQGIHDGELQGKVGFVPEGMMLWVS